MHFDKTIFYYRPSEKKMESNIMENNLKDQLKTMRKDLADKSQRLGKEHLFLKKILITSTGSIITPN